MNLPVNDGNPLPSGVDYIKATLYWYDRQHGAKEGNGHDLFRLTLQENVGSAWNNVLVDHAGDSKLRLFYASDPGGRVFRLRVDGLNVDSIQEGCGTNANRVYFAYVAEENDRDDDAAMSTYVRPEYP